MPGTCFLMVAAAGYQKPAASTFFEENAETMVEGSIGTVFTSLFFIPAFSRARVRIMSPEVPSGTATVLPLSCCIEVMPGWAMTRSALPSVLIATTLALPEAGSHIAPGPM